MSWHAPKRSPQQFHSARYAQKANDDQPQPSRVNLMRLRRAAPDVYGAVLLVNVLLLSVSSFQQSEAKGHQQGTTTRILQRNVNVNSGTEIVGQLEGTTTSIDCSKLEGRPAFSVR